MLGGYLGDYIFSFFFNLVEKNLVESCEYGMRLFTLLVYFP